MNALGLPGTSIDGILGFTVLRGSAIELDPTRDRMTWTRLDYEPARSPPGRAGRTAPAERPQAMRPLDRDPGLAAGGKQPEDQLHPAGFSGSSWREAAGEVRALRRPGRVTRGPGRGRRWATSWSASATAR